MIPRVLLVAVLLAVYGAAPAAAGEPDATAPAYAVGLQGADGGFTWRGREALELTNPGLDVLDAVWLRLWGNGARGCRRGGAVTVGDFEGAVRGRVLRRCTAVELRLAVPLAPGQRTRVAFDVGIRVPRDRPDRFGRGGPRTAVLSNAMPVLAHREAGRWRLDRWFGEGEAWTYPSAAWTVRLDAPPGVAVAAPGVRLPDGSRRVEHGRDYSWAAGRMRRRGARVAGVAVSVWADARSAPGRRIARALRVVRRRLPRLIGSYGPYGWPDLQVVVTSATAMEHTALVMTPASDLVVTHELAHEWWYASVGDDQAAAPWLDEAFATYAEEAVRGRKPHCRRPGPGARLVTRGVDAFRGRADARYGAVYFQGACLLDLLARRMGTGRFRAALRRYAAEHRYGWSTAAAFRAAMDAASPVALDDLWRRYRVV